MQILVNKMQVFLFVLSVSSSVARPIGREIYYDFDYDYGAEHNPHDFDGWLKPLVTTGRTIPSHNCFGVICRYERGDSTPSPSDTTPMSNSVEIIGKTTSGKGTICVLCYNVVIFRPSRFYQGGHLYPGTMCRSPRRY